MRRRHDQNQPQRRKHILHRHRHHDLDDHRRTHATQISHTPSRQPNPDDLATDPRHRQQPAHSLTDRRHPPQKQQRNAPAKQQMPRIRIEQQRQCMKRHQPQQCKPSLTDHLYQAARAFMQHEPDQDRDTQRQARPLQPSQSLHDGCTPLSCTYPNTSAKPPRVAPAASIAAATRGDTSAASSSACR